MNLILPSPTMEVSNNWNLRTLPENDDKFNKKHIATLVKNKPNQTKFKIIIYKKYHITVLQPNVR